MIVVLGAAGFIGAYIVDALVAADIKVLATDIHPVGEEHYRERGVPFAYLDVTQRESFDRCLSGYVGGIINCACWQPANVRADENNPERYIRVNVSGTVNTLEFCRLRSIPMMIGFSSHRVAQGAWNKESTINENVRALRLTGEYAMFALSEGAVEDVIEHYNQQFGVRGVVFRLPPVFGFGGYNEIYYGGKPMRTGFGTFIQRSKKGEPLQVWGDAAQHRDTIYVKDVVRAVLEALWNRNASGVYNLAAGAPVSIEDEAQAVSLVFSPEGKPARVIRVPTKKTDVEPSRLDIRKAWLKLGWRPRYSFYEMLLDYREEETADRFRILAKRKERLHRELLEQE